MNLKQKYGNTALVAGASEGLGAAFATYLAAAGMDLVLIARRKEPLEELAAGLRTQYNIQATCITCDLALPDATDKICTELNRQAVDLLVYNAAIPYIGAFEKNTEQFHANMAQANMVTPMQMAHRFGNGMLNRGKGAVVIMASLAGFQGSGFLTVYAATKAFDRTLAEGLWYEWKNRGVDVIACCAGATATPNFINTKPEKTGLFEPQVQTPEEVVKECFQQLGKRPSFVAGGGNKLATFIMQKLLPRKMAVNLMGNTTRKMYRL